MEVLIAIAVMVSATIAIHLGLPQAIWSVFGKVCECHKCMSFWTILGTLVWLKCDIITAILLSFLMAYLSNWFGLLLVWLNRKYTQLWRNAKKKKKR